MSNNMTVSLVSQLAAILAAGKSVKVSDIETSVRIHVHYARLIIKEAEKQIGEVEQDEGT